MTDPTARTDRSDSDEEYQLEYGVEHLDVGNANAAIVRYRDTTILIDGDHKKHVETIKNELEGPESEFERIEAVVVTHYDNDHTNGIGVLLSDHDVEIGRVIGPDTELYSGLERNDTVLATAEQQGYETDEVATRTQLIGSSRRVNESMNYGPGGSEFSLDIRFPSESYEGVEVDTDGIDGTVNHNDGLAIKSTYTARDSDADFEHSTLFLGDATKDELEALDDEFVQANVLVMFHHGSKENMEFDIDRVGLRSELTKQGNTPPEDLSLTKIDRLIDSRGRFESVANNTRSEFLERSNPDGLVLSAHPDGYSDGTGYTGHPDEVTLAAIYGSDIDPTLHYTKRHGTIRHRANRTGIDLSRDKSRSQNVDDIVESRLRDAQRHRQGENIRTVPRKPQEPEPATVPRVERINADDGSPSVSPDSSVEPDEGIVPETDVEPDVDPDEDENQSID